MASVNTHSQAWAGVANGVETVDTALTEAVDIAGTA